jgi:hypothetical protein
MPPSRQVALLTLALSAAAPAKAEEICLECLSVRVEAPVVVRGPFPDELDSPLGLLPLPDGSLRAFSSNAAVYAIDAPNLDNLYGERRTVLSPGPAGGEADCGRWLNGLAEVDGSLLGLIHREKSCDYEKGRTHKSMALARSEDRGLTWREVGTIIAGEDAPAERKGTGIGDCSWVDGHDGYRYAYCLRLSDWKTTAARAPIGDLSPGQWRSYVEGGWSEDAIGGRATALGFFGAASGYFETLDRVGLVVADQWFGGVRLALSADKDKARFEDFPEPLIPLDGEEWSRPAATELIAYPALIDPTTGRNDLGDEFLLSYTWLPPGKTFADRYLVLHRVRLGATPTVPGIQAGVALTRWRNDAGATTSTTGPVIPAPGLQQEKALGFLLTKAPVPIASLKLEECETRDGSHRLVADGSCAREGGSRLRTAGWVFAEERDGTLPLHRCRDGEAEFVSNEAECEGRGRLIERLGFALQ